MFIPYENIGNFLSIFIKSEKLKNFFYNKKVEQNLLYIKQNKPKVLEKLKQKLKNNQKINVVFYVYDATKWKSQSVYDIFAKDGRFSVKILVTKNAAQNSDNPSFQTVEDVKKTYEFFKNEKLNVELAYDIQKRKFIQFKNFNPDIIFYQHPWYVERSQGPVVCSKFALTAYIPYYFPIEVGNIDNKIDYYLRFHKYVENYYVLDKFIEQKLKSKMDNKGENVKAVGYPNLDYFFNNIKEGEYIIYAPHWTICGKGLKYGAFEWSGQFIFDWAKKHPDTKWIFKPHPLLFNALIDSGFMTEEQTKNYYHEWEKIGKIHTCGDYFELFNQSKMMITDGCSFFGEYFVTEKPLIMIMSEQSPFSSLENPILETYYCARTTDEIDKLLSTIPANDYMKEKRIAALEKLGLKNNNAARNIFDDIMKQIGRENA